jgi:hypothetical protein
MNDVHGLPIRQETSVDASQRRGAKISVNALK